MEKNARTSPVQDKTGMMSVTSLPLLIKKLQRIVRVAI